MSYTYSFTTPPPIGFIINSATGLITIDPTAPPFTGNLSVRVSDGTSSDIKSIPVELVPSVVTPLISSLNRLNVVGGGRVMAAMIEVIQVALIGGGITNFAVLEVTKNFATLAGGGGRIVSTIEEAQPVGFIEVNIRIGAYQLGIGETDQPIADVTRDYSTSGVNQAVTWSIVPGPYSSYGSVSASGLVTALKGTFYSGDSVFAVKATSVAYPSISDTVEYYPISKFTAVEIVPSKTTANPGETITIASRILGSGPGTEANASNLQYVNITVNENRYYSYLSGGLINYTIGSDPGTIEIYGSYYYPPGGYVVNGTANVQVQDPASSLSLVPSYTVANVGGTSWESLSWATLNDDNILTGAAIGDGNSLVSVSIVINLGSPLLIKKIVLAGGDFYDNFGDNASPYLNGATLDYSTNNGATWTTYITVSGVTDTVGNSKEYLPEISAQYWRIRRPQYVATTAFKFYI